MITKTVELTGNSRITYRDGDTIVGEVLTTAVSTGRQLHLVLVHDRDGGSESYDPIMVAMVDDASEADAEVSRWYAGALEFLRSNGVSIATTAEVSQVAGQVAPGSTL